MTTDNLAGCRILVVEDEMLIAVMIEETLQDLGCVVVGPVARLDAALRLARDEVLDAAILNRVQFEIRRFRIRSLPSARAWKTGTTGF